MEKIEYRNISRQVGRLIEAVATVENAQSYGGVTKKELQKIPHADWIPEIMLDYGRRRNGFGVTWRTAGNPSYNGAINLLPLTKIYGGDWAGTVYHGTPDEDPRRRCFKPVDLFAPDTCVGLYHDEHADPQLYYYEFGEEPSPLGLDVQGYYQLLPYSLGFFHWQRLLLELASLAPDAPYTPYDGTARRFAQAMPALLPDFDLSALVAAYRRVRLPQ